MTTTTNMVCPHCQRPGFVTTKSTKVKRGVSGGKVVFAILTLGISILFVGLSQKIAVQRAHCDNCNATWLIQ